MQENEGRERKREREGGREGGKERERDTNTAYISHHQFPPWQGQKLPTGGAGARDYPWAAWGGQRASSLDQSRCEPWWCSWNLRQMGHSGRGRTHYGNDMIVHVYLIALKLGETHGNIWKLNKMPMCTCKQSHNEVFWLTMSTCKPVPAPLKGLAYRVYYCSTIGCKWTHCHHWVRQTC